MGQVEHRRSRVAALRILVWGSLALALGPSKAASGAEQVVFGPKKYQRLEGGSDNFRLPPDLTGPFRVHIKNGRPNGRDRIDSAWLYVNGRGMKKNEARAASLYQKGCEGDDPRSCFTLGVMHAQGLGVKKDEARAASLYTKACEAGDMRGCVNLGMMYEEGVGVEYDDARAASLYAKACEAGEVKGCEKQRELSAP